MKKATLATGQQVVFHDRLLMKQGHPVKRYKLFDGQTRKALPPATLPIDWTKNGQLSFPMDDNDTLGDCMAAAAEHADNTWTGNVGVESVFNDGLTSAWYLALAGGDNGLDEGTLVKGWMGGLPGTPEAIILDSLDVDPTNEAMVASVVELFGGLLFMLSVPDAWVKNWKPGYVWDSGPGIVADPNNGHGIWWNGVNASNWAHGCTWGGDVWLTPAGIALCDPSAFTVLSPRWFNAAGYAPDGQHATVKASLWIQAGGSSAAAAKLVSMFPAPAPGPTPTPVPNPTPVPIPPAPTPVPDPGGIIMSILAILQWLQTFLASPGAASLLSVVEEFVSWFVTQLPKPATPAECEALASKFKMMKGIK
jgi:hypothetical protein